MATINCFFAFDFFLNNAEFRISRARSYFGALARSASIEPEQRHKLVNFCAYYMQRKITFDYLAKTFIIRDTPLKKNASLTLKVVSIAIALGSFQSNGDNVIRELKILLRQYQNGAIASSLTINLDRYFNGFKFEIPEIKIKDRKKVLSIKYSCPQPLCDFLIRELGETAAESVMKCSLSPPEATFRLNTYVLYSAEMRSAFLKEFSEKYYLEPQPVYDGFDLYSAGKSAFNFDLTETAEFRSGKITPMGRSAYLAAHLLDPKSGEIILDACASPGNKTTHMSELSGCQSKIIALDMSASKVAKITDNADRLKLGNVFAMDASSEYVSAADISEKIKGAGPGPELFDKILIDAPCSGLGLLRNRIDLKYRFSSADLTAIAPLQYKILANISKMLKKGGTLLYATCTLNTLENAAQIDKFISENPGFSSVPVAAALKELNLTAQGEPRGNYLQMIPDEEGNEGFFYALLKKE